jgi:hypothetical protein
VTTKTTRRSNLPAFYGWPVEVEVRTVAVVLLADPDDAQVGESVVHGPKFELAVGPDDGDEPVREVRLIRLRANGDWDDYQESAFHRESRDVWTRIA